MPINYLKQIQLGEFNANGYRIEPSKSIATIIEGFYIFSTQTNDTTQLIYNDGFPVLVFLQKRENTVLVNDNGRSFELKSAWASAGSVKNVYIKYNNTFDQVFIVRFHPGAFYKLFGLTASYFRTNPVASFEAIAIDNNFNLSDFFKEVSIDERIAFIEHYIKQSLKPAATSAVLNQTLSYIHKIKGNSTVKALSEDAGVNYKWLERSFLKNVGLLPKEYIQLQRFLHAYLDLVEATDVDLMRIAVSNGYYDANHFLKDFKVYTGKTPLEYLRLQSA
jgi:AraC-like DNA-binding protein